MDHRYVSGIEILRELARNRQQVTGALMPVVFTSNLTQEDNPSSKSNLPWQAETVYSVSQTSQVYLDHQVGEIDGELVLNWDAIDELFPDGVLDDMFAAYCNFIEQLGAIRESPLQDSGSTVWGDLHRDLLPSYQQELFSQVNATEFDFQADNLKLQDLFFRQVAENPQQVAVITDNCTLTYQELSDRTKQLAHKLQQLEQDNKIIAVVLEKGWEQTVAVLGILTAGAAYVPIDPSLPGDRALHILNATSAQCIITTEELANKIEWIAEFNYVVINHNPVGTNRESPLRKSQNLAYIIYTSGSTGMPKGVAISHRGAVNTILDINRRFAVNPKDKILAISSLSFDLSVYDIFGTLAAGGTIVIPDQDATKDAQVWQKLIQEHQITIWNSVPALMEMLLEVSPENNASLRLVMLSGEWINLGLRDRLKGSYYNANLISLGGATEASIWSI